MRVAWEPIHGILCSARILRLRQAAFAGALHAHEALELTWIESGSGVRIVGSRVEPFGPGDLVLVGPGVPHVWLSRADGAEDARATVLQLTPSPALRGLPEWRAGASLAERAQRGLAVEAPMRDPIAAAMARLPDAAGLALLGDALSILAVLADARDGLRPLDPLPHLPTRPDAGRQRRLDALLVWIRAHLHGPLRVEDAARILHVTPGAFGRSFRRLAGRPFTDYVNDLRIAEACLQLRRGDRPIAEIARGCGFATLSHFNRSFRERAGTTPRAYRRSR